MFEMKEYQERAINDLLDKMEYNLDDRQKMYNGVFRAPTGSGKTIMVAELIKRLSNNNDNLSFIWIAPYKLHVQSKDKLDEYYESNKSINCTFFQDLENKQIQENEILFLNWASINKGSKNDIISDNEYGFNLNNVIQNTKMNNRNIILIIDEYHHSSGTKKSTYVIDDIIKPKIRLNVSATPISGGDFNVDVDLDDVKDEEMIKKQININQDISSSKITANTTNEFIIKEALRKRKDILQLYNKLHKNVNPLMLIQLPNKNDTSSITKDEVLSILEQEKLTKTNGNVAEYLADTQEKPKNIDDNDSTIDVLLFKMGIATGWDCPRASILVGLRDVKEVDFSIQTVGRIMRMPELCHYEEEDLNYGYIYTNLVSMEIQTKIDEYFNQYIKPYNAQRIKSYKPINLKSIFIQRKHTQPRLSADFIPILHKNIEQDKFDSSKKNQSRFIEMMEDGTILDTDRSQPIIEKITRREATDQDVQKQFDNFLQECIKEFDDSSVEILRAGFYEYLEKETNNEIEKQKLILDNNNKNYFIGILNKTKEEYKEKQKQLKKIEQTFDWNVPHIMNYADDYKEKIFKKYVMTPAYIKSDSNVEELFMNYLDTQDKIEWWYKNGSFGKENFAIKYYKNNDINAFYIDFIIHTKSGKTYLIDTKSGITTNETITKPKANELSKYNKKYGLFGGIVIQYKNAWYINDNEDYKSHETDLNQWNPLKFD